LDHVSDVGAPWTAERYHDIAHRAGRFNGAYVGGARPPARHLLHAGFARSWVHTLIDELLPYLTDPAQRRRFWQRPGIVGLLGPPADDSLLRFLEDVDQHLTTLERLPSTLCHRDMWPPNLRWPAEGLCVLIDWGFVGMGPIGEDLVQLVWSASDHGVAIEPVPPYLAGPRSTGCDGDERLVRYALAASYTGRDVAAHHHARHARPPGARAVGRRR
jgi:hypothetical protein